MSEFVDDYYCPEESFQDVSGVELTYVLNEEGANVSDMELTAGAWQAEQDWAFNEEE